MKFYHMPAATQAVVALPIASPGDFQIQLIKDISRNR